MLSHLQATNHVVFGSSPKPKQQQETYRRIEAPMFACQQGRFEAHAEWTLSRHQWITSRTKVFSIELNVPKLSFIPRWPICTYHFWLHFPMIFIASPVGSSFAPAHVAMGSVLCRRSPNVFFTFSIPLWRPSVERYLKCAAAVGWLLHGSGGGRDHSWEFLASSGVAAREGWTCAR